jgi:hypothetical protein
VLCTQLPAHTTRAANDHWYLELTTAGVVQHAAVVGDLRHGQQQEQQKQM